ncbi:hypothetical protein PSAC2689_80032 [Paraburkholderia sacchari]
MKVECDARRAGDGAFIVTLRARACAGAPKSTQKLPAVTLECARWSAATVRFEVARRGRYCPKPPYVWRFRRIAHASR